MLTKRVGLLISNFYISLKDINVSFDPPVKVHYEVIPQVCPVLLRLIEEKILILH